MPNPAPKNKEEKIIFSHHVNINHGLLDFDRQKILHSLVKKVMWLSK